MKAILQINISGPKVIMYQQRAEMRRSFASTSKGSKSSTDGSKMACPPNKLNLVFPSNAGTPLDGCHLMRRVFAPAVERAGLKRIRFHDLRHTYASIQISKDVHPKYLQTQMGHSSITVTMDIYGHWMKGLNSEAANGMEDEVFGASGSKTVAER